MSTGKTEATPDGIAQHAPGAKLDAGKVQPGLVVHGFALALWEVARVATFGDTKYTSGGWAHVSNGVARYDDAMLRHLLKSTHLERDSDTGILDLAHVAWNALAKLELAIRQDPDFPRWQDAPQYVKQDAATQPTRTIVHPLAERLYGLISVTTCGAPDKGLADAVNRCLPESTGLVQGKVYEALCHALAYTGGITLGQCSDVLFTYK